MNGTGGLHRLLIEAAGGEDRDRLAVAGSPHDELTYRQLDQLAGAVAHRLRTLGIRRGDRVVLWADKSTAVVVAMQAVLRLGAAYVPVEPTTPARRAALIARDCDARIVLSTETRIPKISAELDPDIDCHVLPERPGDALPQIDEPVRPDDLAYILYTSGSTGTPKGVCISHRAARVFVDWARAKLDARPDDRFANHASLAFDLSVLDLYTAFAAHASVHLVPAEFSNASARLVEFLYEEQITIWYSVPSALSLMMRHGGLLSHPAPTTLRAVLFAGEPFPIAEVRRLARWTGARLLNLYGPTETNVCTWHQVVPPDLDRDRPVPIGVAACGNRVWARRTDGEMCGPGDHGELVVDGPTVMLGYWRGARQTGPYHTGDIVEVLADGSFDYLGRRDGLVKLRGNRVELGEIETTLMAHADVAEAVATVIGCGLDARLVALIVPEPGREPGLLSLKRHMAARLSRYMTIDELHFVDDLPRTANGKVDRATLLSRATGSIDIGSQHG